MNFGQQQVIAWLPSGHTICSTRIIRGKPKIVTFFRKLYLGPVVDSVTLPARLVLPMLQCCGEIPSAAAAEDDRSNSRAHASSSRAQVSESPVSARVMLCLCKLGLHRTIARRKLPSTIPQRGRVAESGLRHSTRNRAWGNPPWVRIPPLPPRRATFSISSISRDLIEPDCELGSRQCSGAVDRGDRRD